MQNTVSKFLIFKPTPIDLIKNVKERIFSIGRLDRKTTGLLLLTNDGELSKKLTHPSHKIKKIYSLQINKPITKDDFNKRFINVAENGNPTIVSIISETVSSGNSFFGRENPFFDDFDSKFMPAVVSVIDSYCSFLEQDYVLLNEKIENGWLFPSYIEKNGVERTVNKCSANLVQLCTY